LERTIYLDNNASTRVDERVIQSMLPFLTENYSNPASPHLLGLKANEAIKASRRQISDLIGSSSNELIFTSGATEALNLAIKGIAENSNKKRRHIITVATEHEAVLNTYKYLENTGFDVSYLSVNSNGEIDLQDYKDSIRDETILVSIMHVNNEIGTIHPIREYAALAHQVGAIFLSDCTQSVGKIPVNVNDLGVDLLCFSGHKIYAPKGIGVLYINKNLRGKLTPLIHGGGQENGLRSGTPNVSSIVALGTACFLANKTMSSEAIRIKEMRDLLEFELLKLPNTSLNGSRGNRIYNVTNICFSGLDANMLIGNIKNVAVSNGSACSSSTLEPSHVLKAIGRPDEDAFSSIRFSLGKYNTRDEIEMAIQSYSKYVLKFHT